jgi:hypothetical protein
MSMRPNDEVLAELDDLEAWSRTGPAGRGTITLLDYVGFVATPDAFFGFAALFWPDTLVHEGHVFLASGFEVASFDAWRDRGLALREIQRVMNHVHVSTVLQNQDISDAVAREVARVLAAVWTRTLGAEGLEVECFGESFHDAAVTFSQRIVLRDGGAAST